MAGGLHAVYLPEWAELAIEREREQLAVKEMRDVKFNEVLKTVIFRGLGGGKK